MAGKLADEPLGTEHHPGRRRHQEGVPLDRGGGAVVVNRTGGQRADGGAVEVEAGEDADGA
jgi:hypothetical protein